ncbi:hypothetical protein BKA82DRAFT_30911 [Pisolithus tinctorius]|uniref:Uncharacterized protein n=1 Tax=Pisolithus tinctorius Marx 270 TaxID=870435 RepID=A0A0C3NCV9_PISTI|nr:hypothetical protein BKA82DRAFT_30911 [Pisolithus tinctorius]KIN98944.1 hypothetical protein M404DRAFT_30911 [Pisolithus tinctorius Marx 270]
MFGQAMAVIIWLFTSDYHPHLDYLLRVFASSSSTSSSALVLSYNSRIYLSNFALPHASLSHSYTLSVSEGRSPCPPILHAHVLTRITSWDHVPCHIGILGFGRCAQSYARRLAAFPPHPIDRIHSRLTHDLPLLLFVPLFSSRFHLATKVVFLGIGHVNLTQKLLNTLPPEFAAFSEPGDRETDSEYLHCQQPLSIQEPVDRTTMSLAGCITDE